MRKKLRKLKFNVLLYFLIFTAIIYFVISGALTRIVGIVEKKIDPKRRPKDKILEGITVEE